MMETRKLSTGGLVVATTLIAAWSSHSAFFQTGASNSACASRVNSLAAVWPRILTVLLIIRFVSVITLHHLVAIRQFVISIMVVAGRSNRRLIALGLLLAFTLAILYLGHELIERLLPSIFLVRIGLVFLVALFGMLALDITPFSERVVMRVGGGLLRLARSAQYKAIVAKTMVTRFAENHKAPWLYIQKLIDSIQVFYRHERARE